MEKVSYSRYMRQPSIYIFGNVYTYANTGMQIRLGRNLPRDFGTFIIRPGGDYNLALRYSGQP